MIVAALGWAAATASVFADDWPQFLGPSRDGIVREAGLIEEIPPAGLKTLWTRPAGAGFASPVAVGERALLFQQTADEEFVECLDVHSGQTRWKAGYKSEFRGSYGSGPGPRATPTVVDGAVFTLGGEGMLQCVRLADGGVVWRRPLHKEFSLPESFFGVSSSPLVVGKLVLVNVGAPPDAGFVAFDAATGATKWQSTNETASYAAPVLARFADRPVALFFARTGLHAVDPADGKQLWFHRWRARGNASVNAATPIVQGDRVFISSSYDTGAVLLQCRIDGVDAVWSGDDSLSCHYNTPVLHDGYLYGIDGRAEGGGRLRAVEFSTGKVAWTKEGFGCASIVGIGDRLLALTDRGDLEMFRANPRQFETLGRTSILNGLCRPGPAIANGRLIARSETEVVCIDIKRP